ncbi:MAG: primase-helicase zinc-binding domain-containing protein, partial [Pseudomonadota bacterium]
MNNVLDLYNKNNQAKKKSSTRGGEFCGPCPACGGNDRFLIWPDDNAGCGAYWCRQCDKKGDNIQFLINFEGKTFMDACEILNIDLKNREQYSPGGYNQPQAKPEWKPRAETVPADLWQQKAKAFVQHAHEVLLNNK